MADDGGNGQGSEHRSIVTGGPEHRKVGKAGIKGESARGESARTVMGRRRLQPRDWCEPDGPASAKHDPSDVRKPRFTTMRRVADLYLVGIAKHIPGQWWSGLPFSYISPTHSQQAGPRTIRGFFMATSRRYSVSVLALVLIFASLYVTGSALSPSRAPMTLNFARTGHTATLLADGRLLVAGGIDGKSSVAQAEIYDPATSLFDATGSLTQSRTRHSATAISGGRVLIIGGIHDGLAVDSTEVFDAATGAFQYGAHLDQPRAGHTATLLPNGQVVVIGGDERGSIEIFNGREFQAIGARLSAPRSEHSALLLADGRILIAGGSSAEGKQLRSAEIFDPEAGEVSSVRNMGAARVHPDLRLMTDGKVQVIGGDDEASMEMFNTEGGYFTARVRLLKVGAPLSQLLSTPARNVAVRAGGSRLHAASQSIGSPETVADAGYTMTELPKAHLALMIGGAPKNAAAGKTVVGFATSAATVTTDKTDYSPGTNVVMSGTGWTPGETVTLTLLEDPNIDTHGPFSSVADDAGNFTNKQFTVDAGDAGISFLLTATGSVSKSVATTTFTDAIPLEQFANGAVGCTTACTTGWQNGNLNANSAHYLEGNSVPYRAQMDALTPGQPYSISIEWDTLSSGKHGLDYLTSFDFSEGTANPCSGIGACTSTSFGTAAIARPTNAPSVFPAGQLLKVFNGSNVSATAYTYTSNAQGQTGITLSFTATKATAVVAWGGHIATRADWAPALAAVDINGSPYHMRLAGGSGNQDRSLSADAVVFPSSVTVNKSVPSGDTQSFAFTTGGPSLGATSFSLSGGGTRVFSNIQTFGNANTTITEAADSNYAPTVTCKDIALNTVVGSGSSSVGFPLPEGVDINCTFTNTKAKLIVKKVISGGPKTASDFQFQVNGGTAQAFSATGQIDLWVNAATYNVTEVPDADYNASYTNCSAVTLAAGQTQTCTITNTFKPTLTITASNASKIYGAALIFAGTEFTTTGLLAGDSVTSVTLTSTGAVTTAGFGTYPIVPSAATGTGLSKYQLVYVNGTLTVAKKAASVTPDAAGKIYGAADPTLSGTPSGFLASDGVTATYTRTAGETVTGGPYTISAALAPASALANYTITYNTAPFIISAKAASVTPNPASKIYGAAEPSPLTTGILTGFLPADNVTATYTRVAGETVAAGPYAITATLSPASVLSNYAITSNTAPFTIQKATPAISVPPASFVYDGQGHPASASASGVSGAVDGTFTFTYNGLTDLPLNVGSYTVVATFTSSNPNYDGNSGSGTITVTPATPSVVVSGGSFPYDGLSHSASATAIGVASATVTGGFTFTYNGSATAPTVAGSYPVVASFTSSNPNYTNASGGGSIVITKVALTVTADDQTRPFGVTNPTLTASFTGFVNSETLATSGVTGAPALTTSAVIASAPADYPISVATGTLSSNNYSFIFVNGKLTVTKATQAITFVQPASPATYNTTFTIAPFADSGLPVTVLASGSCTISGLTVTITSGTGTCTLTASQSGDNNFLPAADVVRTVQAAKAAATITVTPYNVTYDGAAHTATGSATGVGALNLSALLNLSGTTHTNAGPYLADVWSFAGNSNYSAANGTVDDNISKAAATITADAKTKTYADTDPALTYQITAGSLATGDAFTGSLTRVAGENVGPYAINQGTVALSSNYALTYVGANLTITARAATVVADAKSKTYGDVNPALTAVVSGAVNSDTINYTLATTAAQFSAVGGYPIAVTLGLNPNYSVTATNAVLTIGQKTATVVADAKSKTYGDVNPALTAVVSGAVNSDTIIYSLATTAAQSSAVGGYPIAVTLGLNPNYSVTSTDAVLTIGTRAVTITAGAKTKTYGNADPALTYQITTGSLATGDAFAGSLTRAAGENVGAYAITQGTVALSSNYALTYVGANLTITARAVTITADAKTKTYGNADPALTYQITAGTLATGDAFSGSLTRVAGENVGPYAINQGTVALSSNYALTYVGANLTITARAVTITADAKTKTYGNADLALTYQVTTGALVTGDAFTGSLTRDAGENVGSYAIKQGTVALSSNYALTYVGANLTITARAVTISADAKTKTYGNADPALTYQVTTGALVTGDAFTGSLTRDAGENVGSYAIKQGTVALSSNYALSYVGANLTVNSRLITFKADNITRIFGTSTPAFTYSASVGSVVNSDTFGTAVYTTSPTNPAVFVGTYTISLSGLANPNYTVSFDTGTLIINRRAITIGPSDGHTFTGPASAQYSDFATYVVTLQRVLGLLPAQSVTVTLGSGVSASAPVDPLTGIATVNLRLLEPTATSTLVAPGSKIVTLTFNDINPNFVAGAPSPTMTLTITQEDARATYTGDLFVSTGGGSTATITLSAVIKDITAVTGDPAFDSNAGDIRNAKVEFVDNDTSGRPVLCTGVVTLSGTDTKVATATCTYLVTLAPNADDWQKTVGIVVSNYYTDTTNGATTVVEVARGGTGFITGGGYLILSNPAGSGAGDVGSRNNFGFNVKYNKSGTNLQGHLNTIIRRGSSLFQVKVSAMTALTTCFYNTTTSTCTATQPAAATGYWKGVFDGKGVIQDVTNPLLPISIEGNATVHVEMSDVGEPGSGAVAPDTIRLMVKDKTGALYFSSSPTEQAITGGNLQVH